MALSSTSTINGLTFLKDWKWVLFSDLAGKEEHIYHMVG